MPAISQWFVRSGTTCRCLLALFVGMTLPANAQPLRSSIPAAGEGHAACSGLLYVDVIIRVMPILIEVIIVLAILLWWLSRTPTTNPTPEGNANASLAGDDNRAQDGFAATKHQTSARWREIQH